MEEQFDSQEESLYLFSSNQIPKFENDAINTVCQPEGIIMQFRYEQENISGILSDRVSNGDKSLLGMKVMVVFVNVIGKGNTNEIWKPEFYPVRYGKLIKYESVGNLTLFFFQLSNEFIDYKKFDKTRLNELILSLKGRPNNGTSPGSYLTGEFATLQPAFKADFIKSGLSAQQEIIKNLLPLYDNRLFYTFKIKEEHTDGTTTDLAVKRLPLVANPVAGYFLSPKCHYSLILNGYFGIESAKRFKGITLNINDSRKVIKTDYGSVDLGYWQDQIEIQLISEESSSRAQQTILEITSKDSSGADTGRMEIHFNVERSLGFVWWIVAVFIGLIIGVVIPNPIVKGLGSVLATIGVFFLARSYK